MFNTEADLFRPDEKRFRSLHSLEVWEAEVGSGDIIFIPNGWPHQVRNLDTTIAVSYNYIDDVTQSAHEQYLMNAAKYASGTDALVERNLNLMQIAWMRHSKHYPITQEYSEQDVPWATFFRKQTTLMQPQDMFNDITATEAKAVSALFKTDQFHKDL